MRVPFDLVFDVHDAGIVPRMTIAIGTATIARGVTLNPAVRLGGLLLGELPQHDLEVDALGGILVVRGVLPRRGGSTRVTVQRKNKLSGSSSGSASSAA
jgi:hypothetical protein